MLPQSDEPPLAVEEDDEEWESVPLKAADTSARQVDPYSAGGLSVEWDVGPKEGEEQEIENMPYCTYVICTLSIHCLYVRLTCTLCCLCIAWESFKFHLSMQGMRPF